MTGAGRLPVDDPRPELDCLNGLEDVEDSRVSCVMGVFNARGAPICMMLPEFVISTISSSESLPAP